MYYGMNKNRIKIKANAFTASLFPISKINNYNKKH